MNEVYKYWVCREFSNGRPFEDIERKSIRNIISFFLFKLFWR